MLATAMMFCVLAAGLYLTNCYLHVRSIDIVDGKLVIESSPTGHLADPYTDTSYRQLSASLVATIIAASGIVIAVVVGSIFAIAHVLDSARERKI